MSKQKQIATGLPGQEEIGYRGIHMEPYKTEEERLELCDPRNRIFLFDTDNADESKEELKEFFNTKLCQIVNVYKHNIYDFEFNAKKIIEHFRKHYGRMELNMFTLGQYIAFRVHKDQKEPFQLPLFRFFVNYVLLIMPIQTGVDMRKWNPWTPHRWTVDGWIEQMNKNIEVCRGKVNMRKLCECIELSKFLMNLWVSRCGDRLSLSISNNDFIELMKRSEEAFKSITCTFDIPEGISPTDLEKLTSKRTTDLLNFAGEQTDLPISTYARNKLFNPAQFREYAVHICHKPDLSGNTLPYTYPTNVIMGITDPRAYSVDAHGGRKAEITKLNVSEAGTLERALMMLMSPVRYVDINYECNSRHFRKRYIASPADLAKLDGRVFTMSQDSNDFWILDPHNTSLIGKTIYLKTPITCTHPRRREGYICSACYGKLMASLNCDIHIGRIAAAESADEIEQKLLSAKHALQTDTIRVEFDDVFYTYFDLGNGQITLNQDMITESTDPESAFHHLHLEFYPNTMGKNQDGESRHYDRSFHEIVIYDDRDDSRIAISENNNVTLYLSPEFNDEHFLPAMHYRDAKDCIRIPFDDICDTGKLCTNVLFEFSYKNNELADPLNTLERIMFNCDTINAFENYDDCLNTLTPLFIKGGIHIPDYQTEMLVSQMITTPDGKAVDWNDPNPEYVFGSINKSIQRNPSAVTSILYRESGMQVAGAYGTYEKSATSGYDWFLLDRSRKKFAE